MEIFILPQMEKDLSIIILLLIKIKLIKINENINT